MKDNSNIKRVYTYTNFIGLNSMEIELVWNWRNNEDVRKWMYKTDFISYEEHLKFIENLKNELTKLYFLVKRDNTPIGVLSIIDFINRGGEWGLYLGPEYHKRNLAVEFYYNSLIYCFEILKVKSINGYVLYENKSLNSLNDLFGFTKHLVEKTEDGETRKYYFISLARKIWLEKIQYNEKIIRILEITRHKTLT